MKRPRKKLLLAFVFLVVSVAGFFTVEHFRGAWMLKRWKARMATQGEELNIDKLAPRSPPADENGLPPLIWIANQLSSLPTQYHPPAARHAVPGRAVLITRRTDWRVARTNMTWVGVAEKIAEQDSRLAAALEALQSPAFHVTLDYRRGFGLPLPHLARLKGLGQSFTCAALHDLHQGQPQAAFEKLMGALALAQALKDEPVIISQLVRIAIASVTFTAAWDALQYDCWSDAQLAQLQKAWASFDFLTSMERAVSMERTMSVVEYERMRSSQLSLSTVLDPNWTGGAPAPAPSVMSFDWIERMFDVREQVFTPVWRFAWSQQDELHYCRRIQAMLEAARAARAKKSGAAMLQELKRMDEDSVEGPLDHARHLVSRLLAGAVAGSVRRAWTAQATSELAATAIALKRHQLRHGKLPLRLEALTPEFLARAPVDYMDGQPLRYCLDSTSAFLLYSVGLDGRDNDGDPTPTAGSGTANHQNGRDLIWPQHASELETALWASGRR